MDKKNKIVVKKGEEYTLYCSCNFVGTDQEETFVADCDLTQEDLDSDAEQFMWDNLSPEFYWEKS